MKSLSLSILPILIFSSCVEIKFREPQPQNAPDIRSFPDDLIGWWIIDGEEEKKDTMIITKSQLWFANDTTNGKLNKRTINDIGKLRRSGKDYFVNSGKKEEGFVLYWLVFQDNNTFIFKQLNHDEDSTIVRLKEIMEVEEKLDADGKPEEYYVSPGQDQFQLLLSSGIFKESAKLRRFKKDL